MQILRQTSAHPVKAIVPLLIIPAIHPIVWESRTILKSKEGNRKIEDERYDHAFERRVLEFGRF
jgi:hypothetical protein